MGSQSALAEILRIKKTPAFRGWLGKQGQTMGCEFDVLSCLRLSISCCAGFLMRVSQMLCAFVLVRECLVSCSSRGRVSWL